MAVVMVAALEVVVLVVTALVTAAMAATVDGPLVDTIIVCR